MTDKTITIAPVNKSITVKAPQAKAFDVFINGLDRWWPKEHHIGTTKLVKSAFEPRLGGRWVSLHEGGEETVVGTITQWEPPARVVFTWAINAQWKPSTEVGSVVELRFTALDAATTRVDLEHREFESLGLEGGTAMRNGVDGGWTGILENYKNAAEGN